MTTPLVQAAMQVPAFQVTMQAVLQATLPPLLNPMQNTIDGLTNTINGQTNTIAGSKFVSTRILLAKHVNGTRGAGLATPYEEIPTAGGDLPSNLGLPALTDLPAVRALTYAEARSLLLCWNENVPIGPGQLNDARRQIKVYIGSAMPW
ncbi:hypothetical protein EXIGLDRAFT_835715 [Exidia glandulosa HHB12029]|uniref:Mug135-like C-terminal domain-containing protein n=1 Tax=Exidia glandulosa HHB12029 TaxID=1314781 RepID=A0A165IHN8_EXIGL|nr:hypothetical protein EXIGLDRAFT_835715 [Exidia glandulosa HHB12029]